MGGSKARVGAQVCLVSLFVFLILPFIYSLYLTGARPGQDQGYLDYRGAEVSAAPVNDPESSPICQATDSSQDYTHSPAHEFFGRSAESQPFPGLQLCLHWAGFCIPSLDSRSPPFSSDFLIS